MWLDDAKVRALIAQWRTDDGGEFANGRAHAASDLEHLIAESTAPLPPPSPGSKRCMTYGGST